MKGEGVAEILNEIWNEEPFLYLQTDNGPVYSAFKKSRKLYNNYYATKTLHQFGKYFLHFVAVGLAHLAFEKLQDAKRGLVCVPYERIWRGKPFL